VLFVCLKCCETLTIKFRLFDADFYFAVVAGLDNKLKITISANLMHLRQLNLR